LDVVMHLPLRHCQVGSALETCPLPSMLADNLAAMQPNGFGRYRTTPTPRADETDPWNYPLTSRRLSFVLWHPNQMRPTSNRQSSATVKLRTADLHPQSPPSPFQGDSPRPWHSHAKCWVVCDGAEGPTSNASSACLGLNHRDELGSRMTVS